jgi:DSF synthase
MSSTVAWSPDNPTAAPDDLPFIFPTAAVPRLDPQNVDARRMFALEQLEVSWDDSTGSLWTFMRPHGRPSYNLNLLDDFHAWQRGIAAMFGDRGNELRFLILGSRTPGIFSLGGDLDYFMQKIRERDRKALVAYGQSCVRILHKNMNGLGLPAITMALAQGDALGGGFESLLSFNVIIAERQAKFGFPENIFGLFPGMGAYSLLARRVGSPLAEKIILSGKTYTAAEMHEFGLVHILAEPGEGIAEARAYIARSRRRYTGISAVYQAGRHVNTISLKELDRIVQVWADACLELGERDLKVMHRLVSAQDRLRAPPPRLRAVS